MQHSVGITLEPVPRLCRLRVPIMVAQQERHQHRGRDDGQAEQDQAENVRHSRLPWLESRRHLRPGQMVEHPAEAAQCPVSRPDRGYL